MLPTSLAPLRHCQTCHGDRSVLVRLSYLPQLLLLPRSKSKMLPISSNNQKNKNLSSRAMALDMAKSNYQPESLVISRWNLEVCPPEPTQLQPKFRVASEMHFDLKVYWKLEDPVNYIMLVILTATIYRVRRLQRVILMINVGDPSHSLDFILLFSQKKILPKIHDIFSDLGWHPTVGNVLGSIFKTTGLSILGSSAIFIFIF